MQSLRTSKLTKCLYWNRKWDFQTILLWKYFAETLPWSQKYHKAIPHRTDDLLKLGRFSFPLKTWRVSAWIISSFRKLKIPKASRKGSTAFSPRSHHLASQSYWHIKALLKRDSHQTTFSRDRFWIRPWDRKFNMETFVLSKNHHRDTNICWCFLINWSEATKSLSPPAALRCPAGLQPFPLENMAQRTVSPWCSCTSIHDAQEDERHN